MALYNFHGVLCDLGARCYKNNFINFQFMVQALGKFNFNRSQNSINNISFCTNICKLYNTDKISKGL